MADASLLNTETAELAHNVTISQLTQLPIPARLAARATSILQAIAILSRCWPSLACLACSMTATIAWWSTVCRTIRFRFAWKGQTSGNTGGLRQYTAIGQPGADAIQEVAVQTSNFAAEFGAVGGAVFNTVMKSGTNQFHGSAYDYVANEV